jgi:hypothetical protein
VGVSQQPDPGAGCGHSGWRQPVSQYFTG